MNKRGKPILAIGSFAALVLIIWHAVPSGPAEPSYQGRTLSKWMEEGVVSLNPERQARLDLALPAYRSMGTNALPYLLKWMQYEQPAWKTKLLSFANNHLTWIKPHYPDWAQLRAFQAAMAVPRLGPAGDAAIPVLATLARTTNGYPRTWALISLLEIAKASTNAETRVAVSNVLSGMLSESEFSENWPKAQ